MKKIMHAFTAFLLCFATGCSPSSKEVPDSLVSNDITYNFTSYNGINLNAYDECEGTEINVTSHNPDTKAHLDEVTTDINITYPYGTISYSADLIYQYDRGKDNWERIGSERTVPTCNYDLDKFVGQYYYNDTSGFYGSGIHEFLFSISTPEDLPGFIKAEGDLNHYGTDGKLYRTSHFSDVFEISKLKTLDSYGGSFVTPLYSCLEFFGEPGHCLIVLTLTDGLHFQHNYDQFYLSDSSKVINTAEQEQINGWTDFGEDTGNTTN